MERVALICGATGIVGKYLVDSLCSPDCSSGPWKVYALARRTEAAAQICFRTSNYTYVQANLLDSRDCQAKLSSLQDVTHVFWVVWMQGKDEDENCSVNGQMLSNLWDALLPNARLEHVCLQTGAKHYMGPFGSFAPHERPFREDMPRLSGQNFYYTLEDVLLEGVKRAGGDVGYSIHRPTHILGFSVGNLMNLLGTLAVYAAICKHEGLPFVFPGNSLAWDHFTDAACADLIAEQEIWAATTPAARNQAFNVTNGDVFKWKTLWPLLAQELGVDSAPYHGKPLNLASQFGDKSHVWDKIVKEKGLVKTELKDVGHFWFADTVLNLPFEVVSSMNKSKEFGFLSFRNTEKSFQPIIHEMVEAKVIPSFHERCMLRDHS